MKIILLQTHEKLGNVGDIINVKAGFARNYLIPNNLAQAATETNIKALKNWVSQQEMRDAKNGEFYYIEPQRMLTNNSAIYDKRPDQKTLISDT